MYIQNAVYKTIKPKDVPLPIAAGTVLTVSGRIAAEDGSDAFGIVPEKVTNIGPTGKLNVAIGGTIDLTSPANQDAVFSEAMIQALGKDFNFVPASEVPAPENELPVPTPEDAGKAVIVNESGTGYELGSGGSSLPPYTSADKGKGLFLAEDGETVTVIVVPEQTLTTNETVSIETPDGASITLNHAAEVIGGPATYEGAPESAVVTSTPSGGSTTTENVIKTGKGYAPEAYPTMTLVYFDTISGKWYLGYFSEITMTLSATASVPSVEPKWENTGLPVIRVSETLLGATLISTYSEVVEAYASGAALLNIETEIGKKCVLLSPVGYYHSETEHVFPAYTGYYIDETNVLDATVGFTQYKIDIDDTQQTVYLSVVKKNLVFQSQG